MSRRLKTVSDLLRFLRPMLPVVMALGLAATLAEGIGVALTIPLLSLLLGSGAPVGSGWTSEITRLSGADASVQALILLILAFITLRSLIATANGWLIAWLESRVGHRLRTELARRLLGMDYRLLSGEEPGGVISVVSGETWRASDAARHYLNGAAGIASVAAFCGLMALLDWRLLLIVVVGALLIRMLEARLIARTARGSQAVKQANARLADHALRIVLAMRVIRLFGTQRQEQARFADESDRLRHASFAVWASGSSVSPLTEVLHTALLAAVVVVAVRPGSGIALPLVAGFLILLQRVQPHLRVVEQARVQFAGASASLDSIEELLRRADTSASEPRSARAAPALTDGISLEGVSFRYGEDGPPEIDDLSFTIPAHRATALVGASGSGKSTIVNLLCGLLSPTAGRIVVDGVPLTAIDPDSWRAGIAFAGQDADLIDGTVAENIAYGSAEVPFEALAEAIRRADATDFIARLPQGLDTPVGSRGLFLSGGQRQRIALARAFLRRPRLLILDEATSAVDALSEETILERLRADPVAPTVLVISHRASTLQRCDAVIHLSGGRRTPTDADAGTASSPAVAGSR